MERHILLRLIEAAPDPAGFGPAYQKAWDDARAFLRASCPTKHRDTGHGTCADCHADLAQ